MIAMLGKIFEFYGGCHLIPMCTMHWFGRPLRKTLAFHYLNYLTCAADEPPQAIHIFLAGTALARQYS
jgi:hypothetical protein